jgi:hypothetical protein
MSNIRAGDRVKIKDRPDWSMPGGYKLANLEGEVYEVVEDAEEYITVLLDNDITGIDPRIPLPFRMEAVEKV